MAIMQTKAQKRKEERKNKRSKRTTNVKHSHPTTTKSKSKSHNHGTIKAQLTKRKASPTKHSSSQSSPKATPKAAKSRTRNFRVDTTTSAALERDDMEISYLESKMGLSSAKSKKKLNKEYAKLEGFGDDFGDFLEGLDGMIGRLSSDADAQDPPSSVEGDDDDANYDDGNRDPMQADDDDDDDFHDGRELQDAHRPGRIDQDPSLQAMLQQDDQEIAYLERQMGLKNKAKKRKLNKEFAIQDGFGDDFGDFLDNIDSMTASVLKGTKTSGKSTLIEGTTDKSSVDEDGSDTDPRCNGSDDDDIDDDNGGDDSDDGTRNGASDEGNSSDSDDDVAPDLSQVPDHDVQFTYKPSEGQDIYGRNTATEGGDQSATAYVPPHLRKTNILADEDTQEQTKSIKLIVTRSLNRLSEDTLVSVAQSIAGLYQSHPTRLVDDVLWTSTKTLCIDRPMLMEGLIPLFAACLAGIHIQTSDTVQLVADILEKSVEATWAALKTARLSIQTNRGDSENESTEDSAQPLAPAEDKTLENYLLVICYLYNYGILHSSLMYDVVRHFLTHFTSIDIECLLLILNHSGSALRADDPVSLKEIVLSVQAKVKETHGTKYTPRVEFMITTIMDLKNNKRKSKATVRSNNADKFRRIVSRIKARPSSSSAKSEKCLRIPLQDLLQASTRGRWWKVGASWMGKADQLEREGSGAPARNSNRRFSGGLLASDTDPSSSRSTEISAMEAKLLKKAAKYRMNSETKRRIFCILMSATDCDEAFENLSRNELLQNRNERELVRVIMECCQHEKAYNSYYGHLASRICESQPQSKFSFRLAFWDAFKNFEEIKIRAAANLAKLLFHLAVKEDCLRVRSVIKTLDLVDSKPDQSTEVFLTVLFSMIFDHFDDPTNVKDLFRSASSKLDDVTAKPSADDGLNVSILMFLVERFKKSPKNVKGSPFRSNLKAAVKVLGAK